MIDAEDVFAFRCGEPGCPVDVLFERRTPEWEQMIRALYAESWNTDRSAFTKAPPNE